MRSIIILAAGISALVAGAAQAATVFSEDFNGVAGRNYGVGNRVGRFTVTSFDIDVFGQPDTPWACPDGVAGNLCVDLNGNSNGEITSDAMSLVAGTAYTVSFKMAGNGPPSYPSGSYPYLFQVAFGGETHDFSVAPAAPYQTMSFAFTPTASMTTNLVFRSTSSAIPTFWGAIIDDVAVTTPDTGVPEPATWAMMIAGFGMIGGVLRRRSAAAAALA